MEAPRQEVITVQFIMEADGTISDVKQGNGKDAAVEAPSAGSTWASAVVAGKSSPGKIYVWVGNHWKCIKV